MLRVALAFAHRFAPRSPAPGWRLRVVLAGGAFVASMLAAGCGRKVSEGDCRKVAEHLGGVWTAEAKKEETEGPGKEKAADVIRQEGERFTREWMDDCKKDLVGKRVEEKELACLLETKTLADIQSCTENP